MGDDEQFRADEDPTNTQGWGVPVHTPSGVIAYQGQNYIGARVHPSSSTRTAR